MLFVGLRAGVMCLVRRWLGSCVSCVEGWGHVLFVGLRAGVMCLVR